MCACGGDPGALLRRFLHDPASQSQYLGAHLRERAADGAVGLDLGSEQFGRGFPLFAQGFLCPAENLPGTTSQLTGLGVDDLVLFLDPQSVFFRLWRHADYLLLRMLSEDSNLCRVPRSSEMRLRCVLILVTKIAYTSVLNRKAKAPFSPSCVTPQDPADCVHNVA